MPFLVTCTDQSVVSIDLKYAPSSRFLANLLEELGPAPTTDSNKKGLWWFWFSACLLSCRHCSSLWPSAYKIGRFFTAWLFTSAPRNFRLYGWKNTATVPFLLMVCLTNGLCWLDFYLRFDLKSEAKLTDDWELQYCKMDQLTLFEVIKVFMHLWICVIYFHAIAQFIFMWCNSVISYHLCLVGSKLYGHDKMFRFIV